MLVGTNIWANGSQQQYPAGLSRARLQLRQASDWHGTQGRIGLSARKQRWAAEVWERGPVPIHLPMLLPDRLPPVRACQRLTCL